MAIKQFKPTTPGRRGMTSQNFDKITTNKPKKSLLRIKKSTAGRNNSGRITTRHRGAGVKRYYRLIDFVQKHGSDGEIVSIEYDPNRSANIALVKYEGDKFAYVIAANKMKVGQKLANGEEAAIEVGNRLPLKNIPVGSTIYNIELTLGKGGQLVRSAGAKAQLMAKEGAYAQVRLPSGEVRMVHVECSANIGAVGNEQHQNIKWGSAGRRRKLGWRPSVRGKVMNAVDHPHGGGDGGSHGVGREPKTPWGQKTLGFKTRRRKSSDKFVVRKRSQAKRK